MAQKKKAGTSLMKTAKPAKWEWTTDRERCLDYLLAGMPKRQIARELGVHRNTVNNWTARPEFIHEARKRFDEHVNSTRVRRLMETNSFTSRIAKMISKHLDAAETKGDATEMRRAMEWMREYRQFRDQERQDTGDNVQRVQHSGGLLVGGEGEMHHTTHKASFKDFLESMIDDGVVDTDAIEIDTPPGEVIRQVVQQSLTDGGLLDTINEEDKVEGGE